MTLTQAFHRVASEWAKRKPDMRYTLISETYPPEVNGVALTLQALEQGLRARGRAVTVIRPRQNSDKQGDANTVLVRGVGLPRYPGLQLGLPCTRMLVRIWREARPDAIYVATEGPLGWSALRAARRLAIPAATGFHTRFDHYARDYGAAFLQGFALRGMRRFHNAGLATLVPTLQLQQFLQSQGFTNAVRLPRAVDTALFAPGRRDQALRAAWGLTDRNLAVIHVGRIAAEKNLGLAVRAFRQLQTVRPDARFIWVGDGPLRVKLARDNSDFVFCGVQRDEALARNLASGDLFLFPSQSETFGNVTLESLASGVPIVAFDYGAAREYLRDGVYGAAIELGDEAGFIAACVHLAVNDELRSAMRTAAPAAVARLCPGRVAGDFDDLLQKLTTRDNIHVPELHY